MRNSPALPWLEARLTGGVRATSARTSAVATPKGISLRCVLLHKGTLAQPGVIEALLKPALARQQLYRARRQAAREVALTVTPEEFTQLGPRDQQVVVVSAAGDDSPVAAAEGLVRLMLRLQDRHGFWDAWWAPSELIFRPLIGASPGAETKRVVEQAVSAFLRAFAEIQKAHGWQSASSYVNFVTRCLHLFTYLSLRQGCSELRMEVLRLAETLPGGVNARWLKPLVDADGEETLDRRYARQLEGSKFAKVVNRFYGEATARPEVCWSWSKLEKLARGDLEPACIPLSAILTPLRNEFEHWIDEVLRRFKAACPPGFLQSGGGNLFEALHGRSSVSPGTFYGYIKAKSRTKCPVTVRLREFLDDPDRGLADLRGAEFLEHYACLVSSKIFGGHHDRDVGLEDAVQKADRYLQLLTKHAFGDFVPWDQLEERDVIELDQDELEEDIAGAGPGEPAPDNARSEERPRVRVPVNRSVIATFLRCTRSPAGDEQ